MDPLAIYEDLKDKIIWLDFKPGSTLNLAALSNAYQVSRNPVTIALTRLDAEEWVVRNGSHFVVSPLTVDRIREITEIRSVMEVRANLWAMQRMDDQGLAMLNALRDEILTLRDGASNREIVELDVKFHHLLYKETRNKQLTTMLDRMLSHYLRFWLSSPNPIKREAFFKDEIEIIKALETKDEARLETATSAHIKASLDEIMGLS
jgi:GntR family transcriptional regulator, rspAB operon transcriptional repressor